MLARPPRYRPGRASAGSRRGCGASPLRTSAARCAQIGERVVQAAERGSDLAGARFGFGQGRLENRQVKKLTLLPNDGKAASHLGESRPFSPVGRICPALKKCRPAGPKCWEIVARHDIGQRLAVGRDCFGVVPNKPQPRRVFESSRRCRSMRYRFGVGEGAVGKAQGLFDAPEHPQRDGIKYFRRDVGILTEPVGEFGMVRRVIELDGLVKMVMGAGKVSEIPAGDAENAVRD